MIRKVRTTLTQTPPTVLVVDDSEEHRSLVKLILEREGYQVVTCASGEEALRQLGHVQVDLLMLDYIMPGMRGDEVIELVRSNRATSRLPVLMVTAIKEPDEQVRVLDLGADDFVNKPYEPKILLARVRSLVRMKRLNDETENFENVLTSLSSAVEAKDPYTQGHSERVSTIGGLLAQSMGLDETARLLIERAGLIHDMGKIVVDLSFINKNGKLTAEEWAVMKTHPEAGARICAPLRQAIHMIPIIRHHHERLNGRGYPDGLVEDQIPLPVRITSVADVYDALTTNRSYRKAMPHEKAMSILKEEVSDGAWDPEVVRTLSQIDPLQLAE
jgi:putative two-component system response regulator